MIHQRKQLSIAGIYLMQANATFLNYLYEDFDKYCCKFDIHMANSKELHDWRDIEGLLARDHEDCHFQCFIISPILIFLEDLHDLYFSNFHYLCNRLRSEGNINISVPLAAQKDSLSDADVFDIRQLGGLRKTRELLLTGNASVQSFLDLFNIAISQIVLSRGMTPDDISQLPKIKIRAESIVFNLASRISTISILEGLARAVEWIILKQAHATDDCFSSWVKSMLFGHYASTLDILLNEFGSLDIAMIVLNLSLRGRFFPFIAGADIMIEDFYPPMLFHRLVDFMRQELRDCPFIYSDKSYKTYENQLALLMRRAIKTFNLVNSVNEFDQNHSNLDKYFGSAFPSVYNSEAYKRYSQERSRMAMLRAKYYKKVSEDEMSFLERIVTPDRTYLLNHMIWRGNDPESRTFPRQYDWKFIGGCMADWICYGDIHAAKMCETVLMAIESHSPGSIKWIGIERKEIASKLYGIKIIV